MEEEKPKAPDEDELLNAQVALNLEKHRSYLEDPDMIDKNKYSELGKRPAKKKKKKKKRPVNEPLMTPEQVIDEQNSKFGAFEEAGEKDAPNDVQEWAMKEQEISPIAAEATPKS